MHDLQKLLNDFTYSNLLMVLKLFYGYFVIVAISIAIYRLIKYFKTHKPSGTKITEIFDENGKKKPPVDIKPVLKMVIGVFILIIVYFILLCVSVEQNRFVINFIF